ncbi:MAG TPA: hypothetical protein VG079_02580 [Gaiellaceae bacterium]|nr:hypothetical protein [Gaiellaceae bacterium]
MTDDWRLTVEFEEDADALQLAHVLRDLELGEDERGRLGDRVVVSRDGPRVFLYADSERRAREANHVVRPALDERGVAAEIRLHRWHPEEQMWEDPEVPLPRDEEERRAEHARLQEREAAESLTSGLAQWEVRVELPSHADTVAFADRLEGEGLPVVRRWTYVLVGAVNADEARALADRLSAEAPEGARVDVEPGGQMVWEVAPQNPFAVFGGLGS